MFSYAELQAASAEFDVIRRHQWLVWIRSTERFKEDRAAFFIDLEDKLDGLDTMQKRALNVLASKIEKLDRQVSVSGGEDAVRYNMNTEREWLIGEGIESIYNVADYFAANVIDEGNLALTGQREYPFCVE